MSCPIAEAALEIDAPIGIVWQVMTDLAAYPQWNPFVIRIDGGAGGAAVGQELLLHVRWGDGGGVTSVETIVRCDGPAAAGPDLLAATLAYRYQGWLPRLNLVRGTRVQTVEQAAGGPTRYRTREEFTGLLAALVPLRRVQDGFERHAHALKARAEALLRRQQPAT